MLKTYADTKGTGGGGTFPKFSVNKGGTNQTGITSATYTKVTWPTEDYDTNSNFASDKFTPTVAGKYRFTAGVYFSSNLTAQTPVECAIYKNGTIHKSSFNVTPFATGGSAYVSADVDMNGSTDYVEIFGYGTVTVGTATISGDAVYTFWMGSLLP